MKPLDVRKYLYDILSACELLQKFIEGKTLSDYSADPLLRSGVERQFEIIGEALNQAIRLDSSLKTRISETEKIIAFRNRLIHNYYALADATVWGILEADLSVLYQDVKRLLESG